MVRFGGLYLGASWVLLQLAMALEDIMKLPDWVDQTTLALVVVGFPLVFLLAWSRDTQTNDREVGIVGIQGAENETTATTVSGKPSIAILPFVNMSDDSEKEYFAAGVTEDIITGLSLCRYLSVKSRASTFGFKGQSPDVRKLGQDLGVSYIVEGSIRPVADRVRINVQLITAQTGDNLWAEKYDRPAAQLFDIQDAVIASITSALGANISRAESSRAAAMKPSKLSAWEAVQRGPFYRGADGNSEEETNKSIQELRAATRDEPGYAYAHSMLAWLLHYRAINGLTDDADADFHEANGHLQKGLALAGDDPFNLNLCAGAFGYIGQVDKAEELCNRALAIDPNFADIYFNLAQAYSFAGRFEEADKALDRVEQMAPSGPISRYYDWYRSILRSWQGQHEAAEQLQRSTIEQSPSYTSPYVFLAISLAEQGKSAEATQVLDLVLTINPNLTVERLIPLAGFHPDPEQGQHRLQMFKDLWPKKDAKRSTGNSQS